MISVAFRYLDEIRRASMTVRAANKCTCDNQVWRTINDRCYSVNDIAGREPIESTTGTERLFSADEGYRLLKH